jgi:hypothetical protein
MKEDMALGCECMGPIRFYISIYGKEISQGCKFYGDGAIHFSET